MEKFQAWLKQHWKAVAVVGAGIAGVYLLMQRQGAGSAPAAAGGLPDTGPPPQGNQTPTPSYFSSAEQVAADASQQLLAQAAANAVPIGQDKGGHQEYSYGSGAVSKAWQQVTIGGQQLWEDIYHPGHVISEQQAQQLAPQDHGPYARGSGGVLGQLGTFLGSVGQLAARFGAPIPAPISPTVATNTQPAAPVIPGFTPGIAPHSVTYESRF